jgi:hypothetical protein
MTDLQNKYDILLEDIKLLLQYDDKYMKIDKTNIVKPNILNELEKKISELNTNSSKNIDIIKEKNDEIQKLLSLNTNLSLEINKYNIEISNLENEFTTIEKIYNLKKLYTS